MTDRPDHALEASFAGDAPWTGAWRLDPAAAAQDLRSIGEVAREFGVTVRALRFYEAKGLLAPVRKGAARLYGPQERERLGTLLKAKRLGFTLAEIRQMIVAEHDDAGALNISRRQCFDQIKFLEQRKREIESALAELRATYTSYYARLAREPS